LPAAFAVEDNAFGLSGGLVFSLARPRHVDDNILEHARLARQRPAVSDLTGRQAGAGLRVYAAGKQAHPAAPAGSLPTAVGRNLNPGQHG
jgi:hypothetical protein